MRTNPGIAIGVIVVLLWASAFPAIQVAVPALGVIGLSVARLAVALVALLALAVAKRIRIPRARDLGWIVAAGFFGMTAYQLLLNATELEVPAGTASIIVAAAPIVSIAVARLLFHDAVGPATIIGSAVALGGVAVVGLARAGLSLSASVWLAVAAMVVQGVYHPLQRPLLRTYTGLEVATYTMLAGTVMTLPLLPWGWDRLLSAPLEGWLAALYLGLVPSALGFVLWGMAVGRLPVAVSTSLLYLVPPVAVFIAWAWLGEIPSPIELAGGAVALAGVIVITQGRSIARLLRRRGEPRKAARAAGISAAARPGGAARSPR